MKTSALLVLGLALILANTRAQTAATAASTDPLNSMPKPTAFHVVDRGANHRVWQRETYEKAPDGHIVTKVHKLTELTSGMNVQNAQGQWTEAGETIEPYAQGAIARLGAYQVIFAANLNTYGAIDMQTTDGKRLTSNILGIGYYDSSSGQAVLVAQVKDCQGQILSANKVIYDDAFDGVKAAVQYTYKRGGFSQDVILLENPPGPDAYGMNPATTKLEVLTEFVDAPPATVTPSADGTGTMKDEDISWGATRIGHGRAFDLSGQDDAKGVAVQKQYITVQGRKILVEMVPLKAVRRALQQLPQQSSITKPLPFMASAKTNVIPEVRKKLAAQSKPMRLASVCPANRGYLVDYQTLDANETDFTFQGDCTYLISGDVNLAGTTIVESGAVIKIDTNNACSINVLGTLNCQTAAYKPAIFTSADDSTVGESTPSSGGNSDASCTGTLSLHVKNDYYTDLNYVFVYDNNWNLIVDDEGCPSITQGNSKTYSFTAGLGQTYFFDAYSSDWAEFWCYFNPTLNSGTMDVWGEWFAGYSETGNALCTPPPPQPPPVTVALSLAHGGVVHDLHIRNIDVGISSAANYSVTNLQFVNCGTAFKTEGAALYAGNVLLGQVGIGFSGQSFVAKVENITFDQGNHIAETPTGMEGLSSVSLINALLTVVADHGNVPVYMDSGNTKELSSNAGVYEPVGAGSYYLPTGSPYHGAGTANINLLTLVNLATKTTYPPVAYSGVTFPINTNFCPQALRDDSGAPDIGYHYEPIDYFFGGCYFQSNVTFSAGTAVGWFEISMIGFGLTNGRTATFSGTATAPCVFTRYETVQEGNNGNWTDKGWMGGITDQAPYNENNPPKIVAGFTLFSTMACDPNHFRDGAGGEPITAWASDCDFRGQSGGYNVQFAMTNCLFERSWFGNYASTTYPYEIYRNCTFHGGSVEFHHWESGSQYWHSCLRDCAFDGTSFIIDVPFGANTTYGDYDYNAFLQGAAQPPTEGVHTRIVANFNWQSSWFGNFYLPPNSPLIDAGSTTADLVGLYYFTTQTSQLEETNTTVDIGYHYVATDANGCPMETFTHGVADYLQDSVGNGIPDWWEMEWFGNKNHNGHELDAYGRTLAFDYKNRLNPNSASLPPPDIYDFMHVTACAPLPKLSWGFDTANFTPELDLQSFPETPDYWRWSSPPEFVNSSLKPMTFYRRTVTTSTYGGYVGSTDSAGIFSGYFVTKTCVETAQAYPYYMNLWDLDQPLLTGNGNNPATPSLNAATDPTHSQDLRTTGIPSTCEQTLDVNWTTSDGSDWRTAHPRYRTDPRNDDTQAVYNESQDRALPPDVGPTHVTQFFNSPPIPTAPNSSFDGVSLIEKKIELQDAVSWSDYMNQIDNLLNTVPLTPRSLVTTRDGPIFFDYFGVSAAYADRNIIPSTAAYDFNTMEYSFSVTADKMYGIQFGSNEAGMPGSVTASTTFLTGNAWPYYWGPNGCKANATHSPTWSNGNKMNNGKDIPATCCFVSHTGTVTLHAGQSSYPVWQADKDYTAGTEITDLNGHTEICIVSGHSRSSSPPLWATVLNGLTLDNSVEWKAIQTPVTAIVSGAHENQLLVFPLKSGMIIASDPLTTYPAANSRWGDMPGDPWKYPNWFMKEESRIHIPACPLTVGADVADFSSMSGGVPSTNLMIHAVNKYDSSDVEDVPFMSLNTGEYVFGPGNIQTPTKYGNLEFGPSMSSSLAVHLYIDSENSNGFGPPNQSPGEDQIKDDPSLPGKIICVDNDDADGDGIPNFADGFNYDGTLGNADDNAGAVHFVPMVLQVPAGIDVNYAMVHFAYLGSDPANLNYDSNTKTWSATGGNVRIWLKDGDQRRNKASANDLITPGDYVGTGDYTLSQLGFQPSQTSITLYVEGIAASGKLGDIEITVDLHPPWEGLDSLDAVRLTVIQPMLDINRKNGTTVPEGQKHVNGSVVQIVPSGVFPDGYFLTIPTLSLTPSSLSAYVNLKLKEATPSANNAGEIRVYNELPTDDDYSIFMDKTDMDKALTADDLSASWTLDSTSGGVVDLALVAEMQEGPNVVELGRDTIRVSSIPCSPADGRIVFVNPDSTSAAAPFDNFLKNGAHTIASAVGTMEPDDNVLIARRPGASYQESGMWIPNGGIIAGLAGQWTVADPSTTPYPDSDVFDFSRLPIIDGNNSGSTIFGVGGSFAEGSEMGFGGLILTNGFAGANGCGGAIDLYNFQQSMPVTVMCCDFGNNLANRFGGAICLKDVPQAFISHSIFHGDEVSWPSSTADYSQGDGGAIACLTTTLVMSDCDFAGNTAMVTALDGTKPPVGSAGGGGDLFLKAGNLTMSRCRSSLATAGYIIPETPSQDGKDFTGDGGSILVHGDDILGSVVNITDCTFEQSTCYGNGGAIALCDNSSVEDRNLLDKNPLNWPNPPDLAGACVGKFENVTFSNCRGGWQGGAIVANGRSMELVFDGCMFDHCQAGYIQTADGKGGGIAVGGGLVSSSSPLDSVEVKDCTFLSCIATGNGGGLYTTIKGNLILDGGTLVHNCIALNATSGQFEGLGGGVHCSAGGSLTLSDWTSINHNLAAAQGGVCQ